ncbi:hypothetical protein GGR92_002484 [Spirosoma lacussanchae]
MKHNLRTSIYTWLLLMAGSLLSHWLYYDLISNWFQTLGRLYTQSADGLRLSWLSIGLALWLWGGLSFCRTKFSLYKAKTQ